MSGFVFGVEDAGERLRSRAAVVGAAGAVLAVIAVAWLARRFTPDEAPDVTLAGTVFGVVLPLVAYVAVGRVAGERRLDDALRTLSRHGASRRDAAFGAIAATSLRVAAAGAVLAALGALVSHSHTDGAALGDAFTSAWIGALGGVVYVAWFSLGALFGKRGGGRTAALVIDWVLGSASSAIAVPWPRAHLRSLLGGQLVMGLPEWQSTATLYGLLAAYVAIVALRVAR